MFSRNVNFLGEGATMDAKAILDVLMQSGMGRSQQRLERVAGSNNALLEMAGSMLGGGGGSGGLGGMLSQVLGGGAGGHQGTGGGLGNVLGSLLGGGGGSAAAGSGLAGGLIGMLAKAAMSQMAGGGPKDGDDFDLSQFSAGQVESQRDENDRALVMIRAMLSAAKADGQIDADEQQRILGKLNDAGATAEMNRFIQDELQKPVDIEDLAKEVDSPHMATEVYTASLFAIDIDTPGEQAYMNQLATRLGLPQTLVQQLHDSLEVRGA